MKECINDDLRSCSSEGYKQEDKTLRKLAITPCFSNNNIIKDSSIGFDTDVNTVSIIPIVKVKKKRNYYSNMLVLSSFSKGSTILGTIHDERTKMWFRSSSLPFKTPDYTIQ